MNVAQVFTKLMIGNRGPINSKDNFNLKNLKQLPTNPDWILKDIPGLYDSDSSSIIRLHEKSLSEAIRALDTNDTIESLLKGHIIEAPLQLSLMCEVTSPLCSPKSNDRNLSFIMGTSLPELSDLINKPYEEIEYFTELKLENQDKMLERKES